MFLTIIENYFGFSTVQKKKKSSLIQCSSLSFPTGMELGNKNE